MKIHSSIRAGLMLGAAFFSIPGGVEAAEAIDPASVVKAIMADQYSNAYDAKHSCWGYSHETSQGDSMNYCMRPLKFEVVEEKGVQTLYLIAVSAADINDDTNYSYSQVDPGLMGAFKVSLGGPQGWTYKVLENDMEVGIGGQCGCSDMQLVQLSNAGDHGWLFTEGGTWQGVTNASYSLLVPIKGEFKNLSKLPQTLGEKEPDVRYQVSVKADTDATGLYPLHVVKLKANEKIDEFDVAFDPKEALYALPAGR